MITSLNFTDFLYRPRRPEELDTARGGGAVFNQAAHQVDVVRLLATGDVRSVRAATGNWDPARPTEGAYACLLQLEGGYRHSDYSTAGGTSAPQPSTPSISAGGATPWSSTSGSQSRRSRCTRKCSSTLSFAMISSCIPAVNQAWSPSAEKSSSGASYVQTVSIGP